MEHLAVIAALGFAAARGTQLVVHDSIGDPLRARLLMWHMNGVKPGSRNRVRSFVKDLLSCTYCTGWHLSWIAVLAYTLAVGDPAPWSSVAAFFLFGLNSFAVAGVQMIINRYDDTLPSNGGH